MTTRRPTPARLLAGLAPFLLIGLALPLLAPSCGDFQPGVKTFAKGSLIIPMDVCYQCTRQSADGFDTATANCTKANYVTPSITDGAVTISGGKACPGALAQGDVIKAYGLVYQLIRADVAVYWIIDPQKQSLDGYDLAVQYAGGFPVLKLDWASGLPGAAPATGAEGTIRYMGGPFVIDGSDAAKAIAVMKANQAAFGAVNVHVSNVAFQGNVAKTMAGGWSAGGAVPPKLALLDIGSGNLSTRTTAPSATCDTSASASCVKDPTGNTWTCIGSAKNSEPVIREYLAKAGIGTGTAGGTAAGPHGQIYDRLTLADFLPAPGSTDWRTSAFGQGGYQILWVPHWVAPGSCADYGSACRCLATRYTQAQTDQVLKTVGAFSAAGGDVFAECAGLGSFEGAFPEGNLTTASYSFDYQDGDPSTRFQTKTGVRFNALPTNPFPVQDYTPDGVANFASPLMQLGDFPFKPYTGAIEDYRPDDTAAADRNYQPGVTRLIGTRYPATGSPQRDWDFFTFRDKAPGHGSIVYLAGHSYSGVQGSFQAAGSRLVLNTLFNLGAGCTASGVACDTGQFGVCSRGVLTCDATGQRVCTPTAAPAPQESCNGVDDDCDGLVDEDLERSCYAGPAGTQGVGQCRAGVQTCQQAQDGSYGFSACQGEVDPSPEGCNGLDDDCDGEVDELAPGVALSEACYSGPPATAGVGICRAGRRTCTSGSWGGCDGEVTPSGDPCAYAETHPGVGADADCDGALDQGCASCVAGTTRTCYDGPAGTAGTGLCRTGLQTCSAFGEWGVTCAGAVKPVAEICRNDVDENCNGAQDDDPPFCVSCTFRPSATDPTKPDQATTEKLDCWTGPAGAVFKTANPASVCVRGFELCQASGTFGACEQQTLPGPELCNGRDDDCDGTVDEGAECGAGFSCQNGVCVVASCDASERGCPEGYACGAGTCIAASCGGGATCAPGTTCAGGACADPCDPAVIRCGVGSTCAGGYCTGGACYAVGCDAGELCQNGACVPDPCQGVICPSGTFCRQGDCVQACAIVTCGAGEKCDVDGFCVADPCAGKTCSPTQSCVDGTCREDRCVGTACGAGQRCQDGTCVDDPCAGVDCPVGQCRDGQCYAASRVVSAPPAADGGGCGCGGGAGSPLALLGVLLALPLARRRRGRAGGAAALGLLAAAGLAAGGCSKEAAPFDPLACALLDPPLATCETEARCVDHYTDPSHCGGCGQACGAGNTCIPGPSGGQCAPASQVAPHLASVSPPSGSVGALAPVALTLTGERLADGATLRATGPAGTVTVPTSRLPSGQLTAQLDLSTAASGTWTLRVVNPDNVISNGKGFGVAIPTPAITQVIPVPDASPGASTPRVAAGGIRTLRLVGTGLMIGSACKISGATMPEQEVPATLTAAGLECELDLGAVQPGTFQVRVVNDAAHASAPRPFEVVSAQPVLDSISPSSARYNSTTGLQLFGSGFDVTSKVWFIGPGFPSGVAQNTTFVDGTRVVVSLLDLQRCPTAACPETNAGAVPPVQYFVQVRNGALASAQRELVVEASTRSVATIAPPSAWQGDQPRVTISGTGLTGSVIEYRRPGGAFVDAGAIQSADGAVSGIVDLVGTPADRPPAGSYDVRVRFPSGATSASFALRVDSNQAVITATPSPAGAVAGTNAAVVLAVNNLRPPLAAVRVRLSDPTPPAGTTPFSADLVPSAIPTDAGGNPLGTVQVVLPLAGLQTKVHAVSVVNPNGALPSAPYNFTVLPGRPTVTAVACTSVTAAPPGCASATSARLQATPVPVRIDGTNFAKPDAAGNNGSQVRVSAPSIGVVDQLLPAAAVTVTSATRIDVELDTTLAVPATYAISVWNQGGALKSDPLPAAFTILP